MIDYIIGAAVGYTREEIRPFLKSLRSTGYVGRVALFVDKEAAEESREWGVEILPIPQFKKRPYGIHQERFIWIRDVIAELGSLNVFLADTRDVVFQKDPSTIMRDTCLHVFEEADSMTLGSCPYNSKWLEVGYGAEELYTLQSKPILCVGTSYGPSTLMCEYLADLAEEISRLMPTTKYPMDQTAHNHICYRTDSMIIRHPNEIGEVYTVGYLPRESVQIVNGYVANKAGAVPTVVHQWDRHQNLTALVKERYL